MSRLFFQCIFSSVLGLLLSFSVFTSTAASEGADYFLQGITAAKLEDYAAAIRDFELARRAGHTAVALDYNLGVAYFKLKNYAQAEQAFQRLTSDPEMAELAYFNLGLVAARQQNDSEAVQNFQTAYELSVNEKIHNMARSALALMEIDAEDVLQKKKELLRWHGLVDLSVSNDSNINQDNQDLSGIKVESDLVYELFGDAYYYLQGLPNNGMRFDAQARQSQYRTYNVNNFSSVRLALNREFRLGRWASALEVSMQDQKFNSAGDLQVTGVEFKTQAELSKARILQLRVRYSDISATDPVYDYLNGFEDEFLARLYIGEKPNYWRLEYNLQRDDRADYSSQPNVFRSYSPTRHALQISKYFIVTEKLSGQVDLQYRYSAFAKDDVLAGYEPYQRIEHRYRLMLRVDYNFNSDWLMYAATYYTKNDSTRVDAISFAETYSYQRNQMTAGVVWSF